MSIEEQVLTIGQAMNLQKLGLDMSDAALCYLIFTNASNGERYAKPWFCTELCETDEFVPTYTLQEVLDKLPNQIYHAWLYIVKYEKKILYAEDYYNDDSEAVSRFEGESLRDAAYKALCWVLENGYLKEGKK